MINKKYNLMETYKPMAIYYQEADFLEYIRKDVPAVDRRVDDFLTLVLDMYSRDLIGVKLKGFRHLYERILSKGYINKDQEFIPLTELFEKMMTIVGDDIFDKIERRQAYEQAIEVTKHDNVCVDREQLAA